MRPLIAANWKMHKTRAEAESFFASMLDQDLGGADVLICPPSTLLELAHQSLRETGIHLGAQTMHFAENGAYTGEISPVQVKDIGCTHVLIGHSERRHVFGETDETIAKKLKAAIAHDLVPILCVGETDEEREGEMTDDVVRRQLGALDGVSGSVEIAYEPVWAIGTGKTATPEIAEQVHRLIREMTTERFPEARILYGGSVKPENASSLMAKEDIDGLLIGGASLDAASFLSIIEKARLT